MIIDSPAFKNRGKLPELYSFNGLDVSPPLSWYEAPEDTETFVVVCDNADSVKGKWIHWLYYDIPWSVMDLPEDVQKIKSPYTGGLQGINSFNNIGYDGPLTPVHPQRIRFTLYALDTALEMTEAISWKSLEKEMEGHILAEAEYSGIYGR